MPKYSVSSDEIHEQLIAKIATTKFETFDSRLDLLKKIGKSLEYMHSQNIVHGDFNLTNVFLTETLEPILGDFSLTSINGSYRSGGNVPYRAPEHFDVENNQEDNHVTTYAVDVYSFGIAILEFVHVFSIVDFLKMYGDDDDEDEEYATLNENGYFIGKRERFQEQRENYTRISRLCYSLFDEKS